MKWVSGVIATAAEVALVVLLLWKHTSLFTLTAQILVLLIGLFLAVVHCAILVQARIGLREGLTLFILTAPTAALSLSLVLGMTVDLRAAAMVGGCTKEMWQVARTEHVREGCLEQWTDDNVRRMKSERWTYAMLLVSAGLLYRSRWSAAMRDAATSDERSIEPQFRDPKA